MHPALLHILLGLPDSVIYWIVEQDGFKSILTYYDLVPIKLDPELSSTKLFQNEKLQEVVDKLVLLKEDYDKLPAKIQKMFLFIMLFYIWALLSPLF
jgi:hypothetical protein